MKLLGLSLGKFYKKNHKQLKIKHLYFATNCLINIFVKLMLIIKYFFIHLSKKQLKTIKMKDKIELYKFISKIENLGAFNIMIRNYFDDENKSMRLSDNKNWHIFIRKHKDTLEKDLFIKN